MNEQLEFISVAEQELQPTLQITLAECRATERLDIYGTILVSISGGSDSDIVMDLVERFKGNSKVVYVWFDTGLEYEATKRHLTYLEQRYGVTIEKKKAVMPIPISCKTKGLPFLSKDASQKIRQLQHNRFKWEDKPYEELLQEYPNCGDALRWWCNKKNKGKPKGNIRQYAYLKEFMIECPPDFLISDFCCTGAKKRPSKLAIKEYTAVLKVTGERQAEGGIRASIYKSCFTDARHTKKGYEIAQYRPIFFFSDADKRVYEQQHNILHSDCYTDYGMKRTGCAGCPFNSAFEIDLNTIEQYEPNLFKAANNIFGKSYDYTRRYREYKECRKSEAKESNLHPAEQPLNGQQNLFESEGL